METVEKRKNIFRGIIIGIIISLAINGVLAVTLLPRGINYLVSNAQSYKLEPVELGQEEKINEIYSIIDSYYVDDYDKKQLEDGMFTGLVYGLGDVYSSYMDVATFTSFTEQTEGVYEGIGAVVESTEDGRVRIVSPYDGYPAYKAGIQPKDVIMEVNDLDITGAGLENVVSMMKGEPGTSVNLTIYRESESRTFKVDVVREKITMQTISYEMHENNIGYIRISGFERVTYDQFMEALNALISQGAEGFVIDVRNNPGGLLDIVADICNELVPEGTIVYTEDKNGSKRYLKSDKTYLDKPIALLVNGNSASASEILAGAIKDYGVGVLVGEQTFGKGLVQNLYPLEDGSAVKVTVARYYTPSGVCIHGEGVAPDYLVEMDENLSARISSIDFAEDIQLHKALELIGGMIGD